jgi:hypothetical protein
LHLRGKTLQKQNITYNHEAVGSKQLLQSTVVSLLCDCFFEKRLTNIQETWVTKIMYEMLMICIQLFASYQFKQLLRRFIIRTIVVMMTKTINNKIDVHLKTIVAVV